MSKRSTSQDAVRVRSGRPRDPEVHRKVLDAVAQLLADVSYLELTIEKVAAQAGVTRRTVYHWWPNKAALVGELLIRDAVVDDVPDLGDTRRELRLLFDQIVRDGDAGRGAVLPVRWANMGDPAVMARFRAEVLSPRRQYARAAVQRAIARADLPADTDVDLLIDTWSGTVLFRTAVRSETLLATQTDALIDMALTGQVPRLAACPDRRPNSGS